MAPQKPRYGGARKIMAEKYNPTNNTVMEDEDDRPSLQSGLECGFHGACFQRPLHGEFEDSFEDGSHGCGTDLQTGVPGSGRQGDATSCISTEKESNEDNKQEGTETQTDKTEIEEDGHTKGSDTRSDFEKLFQVFKDLGINAPPKPYTRNTNAGEEPEKKTSGSFQLEGQNVIKTQAFTTDTHCESSEHCTVPSEHSVPAGTRSSSEETSVKFCKNLFLKDRKDKFFLVVVPEEIKVDLKMLKQQLGAYRNVSFADEAAMKNKLKLEPGSVSPLALMHESAADVKVAIHERIKKCEEKLAFHPLDGSLQVKMHYWELSKFLESFGHSHLSLSESFEPKSTEDEKIKHKKTKELKTSGKGKPPKSSHISPKDDCSSIVEAGVSKQEEPESGSENDRHSIVPKVSSGTKRSSKEGFLEDSPAGAGENIVSSPSFCNQSRDGYKEKNVCNITTSKTSEGTTLIKGGYTWYNRKGKLRSYVRKLCIQKDAAEVEVLSDKEVTLSSTAIKQSGPQQVSELAGLQISRIEKNSDIQGETLSNPPTHIRLRNDLCQKLVPEVEDFLHSLRELKVSYRDIDISQEDSKSIGPAVGCRCFLLKDKRNHYFFVISHEFYELDHGRLKKALLPRKKVDIAEPIEIIRILGVDPSRITPFAYFSAHVKDAFKVFFTEKILTHDIVLCIQHPFAPGHRIVMTSLELKRYLTNLGAKISIVEERKWHPAPNTIFTQFKSSHDNDANASEPSPVNIFAEKSLGFKEHTRLSRNEFIPKYLHQTAPVFPFTFNDSDAPTFAAKILLATIYQRLRYMFFDRMNDKSQRNFDNEGSCVDPPVDVAVINTDSKIEEHSFANGEPPSQRSPPEDHNEQRESYFSIDDFELRLITLDDVETNLIMHDAKFIIRRNSLKRPVRDELDTIRYSSSSLTTTVDESDDKNEVDSKDKFEDHTCLEKCLKPTFSTNPSEGKDKWDRKSLEAEISYDRDVDKNEDAESDAEDDVEDCSVVHLVAPNSGKHFLIIGSKWDVISKRRFSRLFMIREKLEVLFNQSEPRFFEKACKESGVKYLLSQQLPFSLVTLMNKQFPPPSVLTNEPEITSRDEPVPKPINKTGKSGNSKASSEDPPSVLSKDLKGSRDFKMVLTPSIYIDQDTTIRFYVSESGDQILMKSEDFQNYARKAGFDLWFM